MQVAIDKAKRSGIAIAAVRNRPILALAAITP
jgi:LDH2 family malate/lactate/ureidoglycolate dehydrogenase